MIIMVRNMEAGGHATRTVAESLHPSLQSEGREKWAQFEDKV